MCYAAMAVVVFWHTRKTWIRAVAVIATILVPTAVALARMYRGMHHLTDVLGGAMIGAMCVVFVTWLLRRAEDRRLSTGRDRGVAHGAAVDHDADDRAELAGHAVVERTAEGIER
jgi:membrane-associated phospholipid phosphatase